MKSLIGSLSKGPLDIIGDIHGEIEALTNLLKNLGYNNRGEHSEGRSLVFVGDLVDRGPNSLGVVALVRALVESGRASAIIGNHELNLLRGLQKEGNGWFWECSQVEQERIKAFFGTLPLILSNENLRVVHAAWYGPAVEKLTSITKPESITDLFHEFEKGINQALEAGGWLEGAAKEKDDWGDKIKDKNIKVPNLRNIQHCEEMRQNLNPLKALNSGLEGKADKPFWTNGKWRFLNRLKWWDDYSDEIPVVMGHYWRQYLPFEKNWVEKDDPNLFAGIEPTAWVGKKGNVFCVDYSVGARSQERLYGNVGEKTKLAALRWPEKLLVLDTGEIVKTVRFATS